MDGRTDNGLRGTATPIALAALGSLPVFLLIGGNYPLYHTLVELLVAVTALSVFSIAWHTREIAESDYITFIGLASLPVGVITVLHALAYKGMPVFPQHDTDLPTQLWVIARLIQAASFLVAPYFLTHRLRLPGTALAIFALTGGAATTAAFSGHFPAAFVEGQGLTAFKVWAEYAVVAMTATGALGLFLNRGGLSLGIRLLLWASMGATIFAELAFTLYSDPFGPLNRVGHAAHFAAFALIYFALVRTSLEQPIETLFHQLKERESQLAEAYEIEHDIAETLQDAMAVQPERVPGLDVSHRYLPAPGVGRIGGDFYDVFHIAERLVGFSIGDVCGKGLRAASATMKARTALRTVALESAEPARVLESVNTYLSRELPSDSFVTAVFGTMNLDSGAVELAVAGHPQPVVCGRPEASMPDDMHAPPLGVLPTLDARTWRLTLEVGESLVLVTDGVIEAGGVGRHFGIEGLQDILHSLACQATAEGAVTALVSALELHTGGDLDDDVAIVAIRREA